MPFPLLIPAITAGIGAIGGILNNTKSARTTTSAPTILPEFKTLSDLLRARSEQQIRDSVDLSGYQAQGVGNINQAFDATQQARNNSLTSRGLASSPTAGSVDTNFAQARGGNIADFLNTIPLLQRQIQNDSLNTGMNVLRFGSGNNSVGPGSALAGGFNSAAELLAYMKGMGTF